MIRIIINKKTPTINHLYYHKRNMKFLTKEARELKEYIYEQVKKIDCSSLKNKMLSVRILIYENWLTKKGDVYRKDIANREKFLVDSVFKSVGLEDKFIFDLRYIKIQSQKEMAVIELEQY